MATRHTPGPWYTCGWKNLTVNTASAVINHKGDIGEATIVAMPGGSYLTTEEELKANARLIAAAPELLEALKACEDLLAELERGGAENPELGKARAAIAKAEGN